MAPFDRSLADNGIPVCVAEGTLQCPCLPNFDGAFCDQCAEGYFNFPECQREECNKGLEYRRK